MSKNRIFPEICHFLGISKKKSKANLSQKVKFSQEFVILRHPKKFKINPSQKRSNFSEICHFEVEKSPRKLSFSGILPYQIKARFVSFREYP